MPGSFVLSFLFSILITFIGARLVVFENGTNVENNGNLNYKTNTNANDRKKRILSKTNRNRNRNKVTNGADDSSSVYARDGFHKREMLAIEKSRNSDIKTKNSLSNKNKESRLAIKHANSYNFNSCPSFQSGYSQSPKNVSSRKQHTNTKFKPAFSTPLYNPHIKCTYNPINLPRRLGPVTRDMVEVVKVMMPNVPDAEIEKELQRTGNIELTVERYLRQGTLKDLGY